MLAIQVLLGVSNFVVGQSVKSKVRNSNRVDGESRWSTSTATTGSSSSSRGSSRRNNYPSEDDSAWRDWRGYESSASSSSSRSTSAPVDDWERPPSDDWEAPQDSRSRVSDRVAPEDLRNYEANTPPKRSSRSGSSYSYSYREPQDSPVERSGGERTEPAKKSEPVVDADYRVIVPPYNPLDELIPPPPPPPIEENADDWFEDGTSDEFGDPKPKSP